MVREGMLQVSDRQGMLYPLVSPDSSLKVGKRPPANVNPTPSPRKFNYADGMIGRSATASNCETYPPHPHQSMLH